MKAVYFYGPRDLRLEEAAIPDPGPGEVLVKIGAALTCGTDFKAYRRGHPVMLPHPPHPFGHEFAGTVVRSGPGVLGFARGTRVTVGDSAPCGECFYCRKDQSQLCDHFKVHTGAYAEYNLVPAPIVRHKMLPIPDHAGFAEAALAEPLACAVHAAQSLSVKEGETAAVVGAGPMALLLLQVLAARKARVIVVGRSRKNLEIARAAGADIVLSALDGDPVPAVKKAASGRGADCVFEAVGAPETWRESVLMARTGGRVCFFGGCAPGAELALDAHQIHYGEMSLFGVFHHTPAHFKAAVGLISSRAVKLDRLVSGTVRLKDLPRFFADNCDRSIPKAAVIP